MAASEVSTRSSGRPVIVKVFIHSSAWAVREAVANAQNAMTIESKRCITSSVGRREHTSPRSQTQIRAQSKRGSQNLGVGLRLGRGIRQPDQGSLGKWQIQKGCGGGKGCPKADVFGQQKRGDRP